MAQSFVSSSSEYLEYSAPVTAAAFTMACWFKVPDVTTDYNLMALIDADVSNQWFRMYAAGSSGGDKIRCAASSGGSTIAQTTDTYTANTWNHGGFVVNSGVSRYAYLNGGTGTESTTSRIPTGIDKLQLANHYTTYADCWIAEAAVWSVGLSGAEMVSLAAGVSPLLIRPESLVFYAPLIRNTPDVVSGYTATVGGTPDVVAHPRIIYRSAQILQFPPVAAGGGLDKHWNVRFQNRAKQNPIYLR